MIGCEKCKRKDVDSSSY